MNCNPRELCVRNKKHHSPFYLYHLRLRFVGNCLDVNGVVGPLFEETVDDVRNTSGTASLSLTLARSLTTTKKAAEKIASTASLAASLVSTKKAVEKTTSTTSAASAAGLSVSLTTTKEAADEVSESTGTLSLTLTTCKSGLDVGQKVALGLLLSRGTVVGLALALASVCSAVGSSSSSSDGV